MIKLQASTAYIEKPLVIILQSDTFLTSVSAFLSLKQISKKPSAVITLHPSVTRHLNSSACTAYLVQDLMFSVH